MKRNKVRNILLILLLISCISMAGMAAYFTATDIKTNNFKVKEVKVDLIEPNWEEVLVTPNKTVPKDPQVVNKGSEKAFIFLSVKVPYDNIKTANPNGTKKGISDTELFNYTLNKGWVEVGMPIKDKENGYVEHIYAYGDYDTLQELNVGETTPALFNKVTMCNAIEEDGLENTTVNIVIDAYAIQSSDLGNVAGEDSTSDPQEVLDIFLNQNEKERMALNEYGFYYNTKYSSYNTDGINDFPAGELSFYFKQDGTMDFYVNGSLYMSLPATYSDKTIDISALGAECKVIDGGEALDVPSYWAIIKRGNSVVTKGEYTYCFGHWTSGDTHEPLGTGWGVIYNGSGSPDYSKAKTEYEGYPVLGSISAMGEGLYEW